MPQFVIVWPACSGARVAERPACYICRLTTDLEPSREHPHVPGPSLWPVGFAVGVVALLVGVVVNWLISIAGALIALAFGFLGVRDIARARGLTKAGDMEPERRDGRRP